MFIISQVLVTISPDLNHQHYEHLLYSKERCMNTLNNVIVNNIHHLLQTVSKIIVIANEVRKMPLFLLYTLYKPLYLQCQY